MTENQSRSDIIDPVYKKLFKVIRSLPGELATKSVVGKSEDEGDGGCW